MGIVLQEEENHCHNRRERAVVRNWKKGIDMTLGFRLEVDKNGRIILGGGELNRLDETISFSCPDEDGVNFERCLKALRSGDIIEVRFLPFLPKKGEA